MNVYSGLTSTFCHKTHKMFGISLTISFFFMLKRELGSVFRARQKVLMSQTKNHVIRNLIHLALPTPDIQKSRVWRLRWTPAVSVCYLWCLCTHLHQTQITKFRALDGFNICRKCVFLGPNVLQLFPLLHLMYFVHLRVHVYLFWCHSSIY